MLQNLHIENIAVIERADILFSSGLNALTGETGAGKSIVIDAINAILGHRTSKEIIRSGADKARVSALFCDLSSTALSALEQLGFECDEDGMLLIQRDISTGGKGLCRIGGQPATLSILRELGSSLINIHGQHDNQALLSPERHMQYLDRLGDYQNQLEDYREAFRNLCAVKKELSGFQMDEAEKARRIDLLQYQIDELEAADIQLGEREYLSEQRALIVNAERIVRSVEEARISIGGTEDDSGAAQLMERAADALSSIVEVYPDLEELAKRVQDIAYEVSDVSDELRDKSRQMECDPDDLDTIEERLDVLYRLGCKYGETEEEMLDFLKGAKAELESIEQADERLEQLKRQLEEATEQAKTLALQVSQGRRKAAILLEKQVKDQLTFLDMPGVTFEAAFHPCALYADGAETMEFLISVNQGEPPKALAKIASGGELSRIMLAIKTALADKDDIDTLIFDEVDTGISGRAAQKVGQKLHQIAESRQVICVTHSAQIAALANSHLLIEKQVREGRTYTQVTRMELAQRVQEIARIIGGESITSVSLQNAQEMLDLGQQTSN